MRSLLAGLMITTLWMLVSCESETSSTQPNRKEARAALLQVATNQERFYLQNNTYTTDLTALGFPVAANFVTDTGSYKINVGAADPNDFTATATYNGADAEAQECRWLGIDGYGNKTSGPNSDCWMR